MALVSLAKMQNDIMDFIDMRVLGKDSAQMPAYGPRARFTYFTCLPKELRLKIWSFATPTGTIIKAKNEICIGEELDYPLSYKDELWTWSASETTSYNRPIPSVLHTCLYDYYGKRPLDVLIGILQSVYKKYDTLIQIHKEATQLLQPTRQPLEIYWVTTYRVPTYGPKMLDAFQTGCACIHLASIPDCISSITTRHRGAVQWVLQALRKSAELISSKTVSET
ncbi:hypothetical protein HYALB_00004366 [Hymenoscyphus albidus]|uniref:2EXR domain-containing protein n=1 Tax=Hymenoscyphus albidus TaxID=595503 RepID=A0A9N9LFR0_9HELO|nr:hypothetical protein HYALB_00004366 [Hymenoscyphus albidus]